MKVTIFRHEGSPDSIFLGSFIMAHLFIVFFRSNGNQKIFQLYPYRFTVVPLVLFLGAVRLEVGGDQRPPCWPRGGTSTTRAFRPSGWAGSTTPARATTRPSAAAWTTC